MTNFDAVDFSQRCPEEVISFFWRSVYIHPKAQFHFFWGLMYSVKFKDSLSFKGTAFA